MYMNTIELQMFYVLVLIIATDFVLAEEVKKGLIVHSLLGQKVRLACDVKNKTEECQWTKDELSLHTDPNTRGILKILFGHDLQQLL
jgi:hypothetical protein